MKGGWCSTTSKTVGNNGMLACSVGAGFWVVFLSLVVGSGGCSCCWFVGLLLVPVLFV